MKIARSSKTNPQTKNAWPEDGLEAVPHCPVCGYSQRRLLFSGLCDRAYRCAPGRWSVQQCDGCGSAYLDPRPTPATIGLAYLEYCTHAPLSGVSYANASPWRRFRIAQRNAYLNANYGYHLKPAAWNPFFLSAARRRRFDSFTGRLHFPGPGARVLDIGCGNGSFLWQMRSLDWEVCGVEPDPKSAAIAREAGLDVRSGLLPQQTFPDACFDGIVMTHVIEHLHEPMDTLRHCWKLLKPGGQITISTPNFGSRGQKIYGPDWFALMPPTHLVLFTESSLRGALERCGFFVSRPAHASLKAQEWFPESAIFRQNGEHVGVDSTLPWFKWLTVKWLAWRANCATKKNPALTEELVLLGKKPV